MRGKTNTQRTLKNKSDIQMFKLTNTMQSEHLRAKEIKNLYVPSEVPERSVFRTLFRKSINDCEDKKHQA